MEYDSVFKKNEMMPFAAACLDLEIIALREVSQRKANIMWLDLYAESAKQYKLTYLQNRNRLTNIKSKLVATKGGGGGGINCEYLINRCTLLYTK